MTQFLQATVNGLLQGGLLALVAVGFSLVWGVMNIVNLAHGAFVLIGAYIAWKLDTALPSGQLAQIAERDGTVHAYTLFTGFRPARIDALSCGKKN